MSRFQISRLTTQNRETTNVPEILRLLLQLATTQHPLDLLLQPEGVPSIEKLRLPIARLLLLNVDRL